jgi:huntingtin
VTTITPQLSNQSDDVRDEDGSLIISSPSPAASQSSSVPFQACDVGSFTDTAVPLVYCSRHLAASFLLTGCAGFTIPDSSVRVSVKALALSCIANILRLSPNIIFLSIDKNKEPSGMQDGNKIRILFHEACEFNAMRTINLVVYCIICCHFVRESSILQEYNHSTKHGNFNGC